MDDLPKLKKNLCIFHHFEKSFVFFTTLKNLCIFPPGQVAHYNINSSRLTVSTILVSSFSSTGSSNSPSSATNLTIHDVYFESTVVILPDRSKG
jgi:hypothetical protein